MIQQQHSATLLCTLWRASAMVSRSTRLSSHSTHMLRAPLVTSTVRPFLLAFPEGEDARVQPFQHSCDLRSGAVVVHRTLCRLGTEGLRKGEGIVAADHDPALVGGDRVRAIRGVAA